MTIRDLRPADAFQVREFLRDQFPEEEAILGTRPEGFAKVIHRVFRWDSRLILGLLRLVRRPVFRFFVIEADRRIAATTLLTFSKRTGYVSMVVVAPAYRRHGFARQLLEHARQTTVARGKPYIALEVLAANTPARTLYESIGYRPLRSAAYFVHDHPASFAPGPRAVPGLRPFRKSDAVSLAELARTNNPPEVEAVLPTTAGDIIGSAWVSQLLATEVAAWVVDPGAGPTAWVGAAVSVATEAAHLTSPIVGPSVAPETARALVGTAVAWCAARRAPRITARLPAENRRGRAAVEGVGFREAIPLWTLYRPAA